MNDIDKKVKDLLIEHQPLIVNYEMLVKKLVVNIYELELRNSILTDSNISRDILINKLITEVNNKENEKAEFVKNLEFISEQEDAEYIKEILNKYKEI